MLLRTSVGGKPMCASVCPSEALWYGTPDEFAAGRQGVLGSGFVFGNQPVTTKVRVVLDDSPGPLDVLAGRLAPRQWLDDPFGLEEGARARHRCGGGTSPTRPRARTT